jgi:hypothetical protein
MEALTIMKTYSTCQKLRRQHHRDRSSTYDLRLRPRLDQSGFSTVLLDPTSQFSTRFV